MFCSACGFESKLEVHYCKRCGNTLGPQAIQAVNSISLTGPSWAMAVAIIVMIGIIFSGVVKMAEMGISAVALTWMVIVGLGTVVALVAIMFHQLSRLMTNSNAKMLTGAPKQQIMPELFQPAQGVLPGPLPSVTEHTTRAFEPAYRDQAGRRD